MCGADTRLAVYGTLAPGRPNHHQLDGLPGRWLSGTVNGTLLREGWGATLGYPGIILDSSAPAVDIQLFESADLPKHWARLDAFEGSGYRRALATVHTAQGAVDAYIYEVAKPSG